MHNKFQPTIAAGPISKYLLLINTLALCAYATWWLQPEHIGQPVLFGLLLIGEIYHIAMSLLFWHAMWPSKANDHIGRLVLPKNPPSVDIFITVCGEPVEIVRETAIAARDNSYPNHQVYLLNDSKVAKKENWREYEELAHELGIHCITRDIGGGAKAGNINNALAQTTGDIMVVFDADMVPVPDFLKKVIPYFNNHQIGFVQSPQYYKNHQVNDITAGSWEQQALFFGPIMRGKNSRNTAFICGTNVAIRRSAIVEVGGMCEDNIAEDFITSFLIHEKGWKSIYVPEVLAQGLAPEDLLSYFKQQLRWARGSLEVLFRFNPLFRKGLSIHQKAQYLSSSFYYFNGLIVLIDMAMPVVFLLTGLEPVHGTTTNFALFFLPIMAMTLYTLYIASGKTITFRAISFSMSSWTLQLIALWSIITGQKMGFSVTPKNAQTGNFIHLALPHIIYTGIWIAAAIYSALQDGITPAWTTNIAWCLFNSALFYPFIKAAYPWQTIPQQAIKLIPFLSSRKANV